MSPLPIADAAFLSSRTTAEFALHVIDANGGVVSLALSLAVRARYGAFAVAFFTGSHNFDSWFGLTLNFVDAVVLFPSFLSATNTVGGLVCETLSEVEEQARAPLSQISALPATNLWT